MPPTVFITARFRSGSTLLWNIFRQHPDVAAFYEPLHEKLPQWIASGVPPQSSHDHVDTYFSEYPPLDDLKKQHMSEFGVCRLYLDASDQHPQLRQYIQYLLDLARARHKIPVLQYNRVDFRLPWLKANFPEAILIHLSRSPRDQWCSSIAGYPGDVEQNLETDPYLITTWSRDLCQQFPFLASPYIRHPYQRHYYLWKLSYLAGSQLADVSIAYEDLLTSPEQTITKIFQLLGLESQAYLDQCTAVVVQKPVGKWSAYQSATWFTSLEEECEAMLTRLGVNDQFGTQPLAEIIANSREYQQLLADRSVLVWGIRSAQLAFIDQVCLAEEKEITNRQLEYALEHPLRPFLKHYLPRSLQDAIRWLRRRFQPKLGQLHHHAPIPLKIPAYNTRPIKVSSQRRPVVSIVTPSFNHARFLERTMQSVLGQEYPQVEYIVQDGNSTDETRDILKTYQPQLTHLESCPDTGQANAINRGFRHATGEIMAWLNSDDVLLPGAVCTVVEFFLTHPQVDVVYGHRVIINEADQEIGRWVLPPHDANVLLWADYIPQETLFWRRRIWEKAGGYVDESYQFALDWELLLRFRGAGATFARLPHFLAAFRVHPQQKTSAIFEGTGKQEMHWLRQRYHGREVSDREARQQIRGYLRQHLLCDALYRMGIGKY
ncbi:glycosyltransferase [candidate division KSB3 bacterium]|uniref:Glycosyltransferase n=1 Tax=candidate division KSB3 bacterium TaxID=2044937 RepID=A0A9D5JYN8_9BACT|nr:glycosyltransferase [candidate division KSB3 bacterium]MBD3326553.1 glycosyltransferase [candidate division KSB3 bacterium]